MSPVRSIRQKFHGAFHTIRLNKNKTDIKLKICVKDIYRILNKFYHSRGALSSNNRVDLS